MKRVLSLVYSAIGLVVLGDSVWLAFREEWPHATWCAVMAVFLFLPAKEYKGK